MYFGGLLIATDMLRSLKAHGLHHFELLQLLPWQFALAENNTLSIRENASLTITDSTIELGQTNWVKVEGSGAINLLRCKFIMSDYFSW
jgi:hypothetical protein